jgi:hypothetical protein
VKRAAIATCASAIAVLSRLQPAIVNAQITAQVRPAPTPPWNKGILPISAESYYNAIECGKQGGDNPACVFWDTDICKNDIRQSGQRYPSPRIRERWPGPTATT